MTTEQVQGNADDERVEMIRAAQTEPSDVWDRTIRYVLADVRKEALREVRDEFAMMYRPLEEHAAQLEAERERWKP